MVHSRIVRSSVVGVSLAALLLAAVAVWQVGWADSRARVAGLLDDWHIVGQRTTLLRRAAACEKSDPRHDAEEAVRKGDSRVLGFSCNLEGPLVVPGGADVAVAASRKQLNVRVLFLGSIDGPEFERYRKAMERYASLYKAAVLRLVADRGGAS